MLAPQMCNPLQLTARERERFERKFTRAGDDECWQWHAAVGPKGHGQFGLRGRLRIAHRLVMEMAGLDINGLDVHHLCGNTRCVNPAHLVALAHGEHSRLHATHGDSEYCKRGHLRSDNTHIRKDGTPVCRACHRGYEQERRRLLHV